MYTKMGAPMAEVMTPRGISEFSMMTEGVWWPHAYSALVLVMVIVGYITYLLMQRIDISTGARRR